LKIFVFLSNKHPTINMLFEIQRACPRPGQSRVIASGPSAIKTLAALTSLRPNTKINVIPSVTEKVEFGNMPDLRGPVPQPSVDETEPMEVDTDTPCRFDEEDESSDDDDITIAELMWDIHNDITLADLAKQIIREEKRLKKKKEKDVSSEDEEPFEFVDEATFWMRSREHLPSF
jgi:hypothetical protein